MRNDHSGIEALNQHDTRMPMFDVSFEHVAGLADMLTRIGAKVDKGVLCASLATGHLSDYLNKVDGANRDAITHTVAKWFEGMRIAELN